MIRSNWNGFQYTGAPYIASAGLYQMGARHYNPGVGRFISRDTWQGSPWVPWTQHLYAYVGNSPVNYIDPTGHEPTAFYQLGKEFQDLFQSVTTGFMEYKGPPISTLYGSRIPDFISPTALVETKNDGSATASGDGTVR